MTDQKHTCPECDGVRLHRSCPTAATGGYGPDLLPGLSKWFSAAEFNVVVCADCGLTRLFATKESVARISGSERWEPLR